MGNKRYEYINTGSEEHVSLRVQSAKLLKKYNALDYENSVEKRKILEKLLGSIDKNVHIGTNFYCDSGKNIFIGKDVIAGPNCTFIDNEKITIGSCVMLAPNVQIYTSYHPILPKERYILDRAEDDPMYFRTCADSVEIKDGVWIDGGVIILPGVTIGENSIIGAGSIVTSSMPDNCVAVGNPCKPIKFFDDIRNFRNNYEKM